MLKARKFTAHAPCHVTCKQGVKSRFKSHCCANRRLPVAQMRSLFTVTIPRNTKKLRATASCRLRQAVGGSDASSVRCERVFLVHRPAQDEHAQRYVGPVCVTAVQVGN